jgi:branched-chain amino acid transport system permease protein
VLEKLLQTVMDGLAVGSLYALIALGYTMVYGILKFINFAHSDVFVLGAWLSYTLSLNAGLAGDDPSPIARWVYIVLILLAIASALSWAWEKAAIPRISPDWRSRLPKPGLASILSVVTVWGWSALLVGLAARWIGQGAAIGSARRTIAGGIILIAAMAICGLVGFTIERTAYKPLRRAPRLNVLITAIGVSLLLQNIGQLDWMFGTRPQGMPKLLPDSNIASILGNDGTDGSKFVPPVNIRLIDVVGAGTAIVLMVLLDFLVFRTKLGRAMRAVSYNEKVAALMGIPVDRVISFTFVLGAALAAAAGFLIGQKYSGINQTAAAIWVLLGLKAFVAAVVGGIGNIRGAMLGGLLIGMAEMLAKAYQSPAVADIYVFAILILVLLFRPSGILGKTAQEKV